MTYITISTERNNRIQQVFSEHNLDLKDNDLIGLTELLKMDTTKSNEDFLYEFRNIKSQHQIIKQLCEPIGFFGSIGYAFRGDDYRAQRYKKILEQLKIGVRSDTNNNYFTIESSNVKKSICEKVELIKNDYLQKTYLNNTCEDFKKDLRVFIELDTFNKNIGNNLTKIIKTDIQKENDSLKIWNAFKEANPEYAVLKNTQNENVVNIQNKTIKNLKNEALKSLNLKGISLFDEKGNLTESAVSAIKRQQSALTKISSLYRGYVARRQLNEKKNKTIDAKSKALIWNYMKKLNKTIKYSPTAAEVNGEPRRKILEMKENTNFRKQDTNKEIYRNSIKNGIASCGELARILYGTLLNDCTISREIKTKIKIVGFKSPDDHIFLLIGNINDPKSIIIDPWIKYLNLKPVAGYRSKPVDSNRDVGFMGSKEQYIKFIESHEDGVYLNKDHKHIIIAKNPNSAEEITL